METATFRVSERGQMALPAAARRRWGLGDGGAVEIADVGYALVIVPAGNGGFRSLLREAIGDAGEYHALAARAAEADTDLT